MTSSWKRFENRSPLAALFLPAFLTMTTLYLCPISSFCFAFTSYRYGHPEGITLTYLALLTRNGWLNLSPRAYEPVFQGGVRVLNYSLPRSTIFHALAKPSRNALANNSG